jgi:hypothetical protein
MIAGPGSWGISPGGLRWPPIVLVLVLVLDFNRARRTMMTDLAQKLRPVNPSHAGNNSFEHEHEHH